MRVAVASAAGSDPWRAAWAPRPGARPGGSGTGLRVGPGGGGRAPRPGSPVASPGPTARRVVGGTTARLPVLPGVSGDVGSAVGAERRAGSTAGAPGRPRVVRRAELRVLAPADEHVGGGTRCGSRRGVAGRTGGGAGVGAAAGRRAAARGRAGRRRARDAGQRGGVHGVDDVEHRAVLDHLADEVVLGQGAATRVDDAGTRRETPGCEQVGDAGAEGHGEVGRGRAEADRQSPHRREGARHLPPPARGVGRRRRSGPPCDRANGTNPNDATGATRAERSDVSSGGLECHGGACDGHTGCRRSCYSSYRPFSGHFPGSEQGLHRPERG